MTTYYDNGIEKGNAPGGEDGVQVYNRDGQPKARLNVRTVSYDLTEDVNDLNITDLGQADILRVNGNGGTWKITGIAGGWPGRRLLVVNAYEGDGYYFALSYNDPGSSAENRISSGGNEPVIFVGSNVELIYDGFYQTWLLLSSTIVLNGMSDNKTYRDHLLRDITTSASGAASSANITASGTAPVVALITGTDAAGRSGFVNSAGNIWSNLSVGAPMFCTGRVNLQGGLSDGTTTYVVRHGFLDSSSAEPTNGMFFRYTHTENSGNWTAVCRKGGTETTADTGVAVALNTSYFFGVVSYDIARVQFYISVTHGGPSIYKANITSNIPTNNTFPVSVGASIIKSAGGSTRTLFSYPYSVTGLGS